MQESRRYGIGRLLLLARQDFIARLTRRMNGEGEIAMLARGRLLPYIDIDGTRSADSARRVGVTRHCADAVGAPDTPGLRAIAHSGKDGRDPTPTDKDALGATSIRMRIKSRA